MGPESSIRWNAIRLGSLNRRERHALVYAKYRGFESQPMAEFTGDLQSVAAFGDKTCIHLPNGNPVQS